MSTITSLPSATGIDPVADYLAIDTASISTTQKINRNTLLGLSSAPVGLTDTQTLTSKTLTSPTINGATLSGTLSGTYTIGGTPTFPSTVVQTTASQTLTNKTLTSPSITSPTITNATISADAITGYTTANAGTIYGVSVTGGTINGSSITANSITNSQLANNTVFSGKLGLSNAYSGGVASYTNAGSAGGTGYYVNLGGLKLCWGITNVVTLSGVSGASFTINFPTSFFSSIQSCTLTPTGGTDTGQFALGVSSNTTPTTTSVSFYLFFGPNTATTLSNQISWFVIGT